ncbi:MAG TPA: hypothetical protein VMV56_05910 [Williamwhitmania sp.]|nr:hypothetical protein [Williamwhitmania sp.]
MGGKATNINTTNGENIMLYLSSTKYVQGSEFLYGELKEGDTAPLKSSSFLDCLLVSGKRFLSLKRNCPVLIKPLSDDVNINGNTPLLPNVTYRVNMILKGDAGTYTQISVNKWYGC